MKARPSGSSQGELIPRSRNPIIPIDPNHRLVRIADLLDWIKIVPEFEKLRRSKVGPAVRVNSLFDRIVFELADG